MNKKEIIASVISGGLLLGLFCAFDGWAVGIVMMALFLAAGGWVEHYERTHPGTAPTVADREAVFKLLDQITGLCTFQAIQRSASPWECLGRCILLVILLPVYLMSFFLRWILRFTDWLHT